jgi:hypothetical protein
MKTRKRIDTGLNDLEAVIAKGKATVEERQESKDGRGRPRNKVKKKQCVFYLPEDVVQGIDAHCRGNKSVFAEEAFRAWFSANKIEL